MPKLKKQLTSTGYLVRETIKGLPEAGKTVGGAIGKAAGQAMKAPFSLAKKYYNKKQEDYKKIEGTQKDPNYKYYPKKKK
jgi:hypothetical protein